MADRTSLPVLVEVNNWRLILSDGHVEHGQKVKTFNLDKGAIDSMSIKSVEGRLNEHFGFRELLAERGLGANALTEGTGGLTIVGNDGSRHAHITTDEQLVTFFKTIRNTKMPSLEIKLMLPGAIHRAAARDAPYTERKVARDRVEELEDTNFRMSKATQQIQNSVNELSRGAATDREEAQRLNMLTNKELGTKIDANRQEYLRDSQKFKDAAEGVQVENDTIRKAMKEFEKKSQQSLDKMMQQIDEMNAAMNSKFESMSTEIEGLKSVDEDIKEQLEGVDKEVRAANSLAKKMDETKVQKSDWQNAEDAMSKRIDMEMAAFRQKLADTESTLRSRFEKTFADKDDADKAFKADVQGISDRLEEQMKKMDADVQSGISQIVANMDKTKADLQTMVKGEVSGISASADKRFADVQAEAKTLEKAMTDKVHELSAKTEATFVGVEGRMDNLVKAERSRLSNIEKDMAETSARLRSDCRAEVERVRVDYEQEAARLDADLSDLHMKHDVIKQEINFFQSRLLEQRDWAQRQLAETATATRAAQVDAQEGVAAATKMAHALRDDQVGFRDKMAKHISLLQHASDSYGDAINALETQRSRMRLELDAILSDHKAYVTDMDGWADDVRVKVERLFRAMEPPRCEWRVAGALAKIKDMKKPLPMRSPSFALQGLREVSLELYPYGTNQSPDGKAVLRLCMPPSANVRYQCWLGRLTEGSKEYESGGSLSVDLLFDSWKDQVTDDGSLVVVLEILQDLTNDDESLARAVRLDT